MVDRVSNTTEAAAYLRTLTPWDFRQEQWDATARCLCAAADEIDRLLIRVHRLEGYSEGLRERLTAVRRAVGCNHD
jgi:hypothetical protein